MRAIRYVWRHVAWALAVGQLLIVASMLLAPMAAAETPSQAGVSWNYRLLGKLNSALDPTTGRTIVITGSGSFNIAVASINGGGAYTVLDAGGSVVGSGTWTAATFGSFTSASPGFSPGEGGHLELEAQFHGTGAGALEGLNHMVVQCSMWGLTTVEPRGYPWPADFVEAGSYTVHRTGGVMFNLNQ